MAHPRLPPFLLALLMVVSLAAPSVVVANHESNLKGFVPVSFMHSDDGGEKL